VSARAGTPDESLVSAIQSVPLVLLPDDARVDVPAAAKVELVDLDPLELVIQNAQVEANVVSNETRRLVKPVSHGLGAILEERLGFQVCGSDTVDCGRAG